MDEALPFGLRSAPLIFTGVADALQWMMEQRGGEDIDHYVDDFLTVGPPGSQHCYRSKVVMQETCDEVGMPTESEKDGGPSTTISFLGMELDSLAMVIRLPPEKLARMKSKLLSWRGRKSGKKRELLSLIGVLAHACKAVRAGRSFLQRLINLSMTAKHLDHFTRLSVEARSDIEWWYPFSESWNGISMMRVLKVEKATTVITSDASGGWGCGAYTDNKWFMLQWGVAVANSHITVKELIPIVIAAAIWGPEWRGQTVQARCGNSAVVAIVNSGSSKNAEAMHLARCLAFITAKFECDIVATHIRGIDNTIADAISRDNLSLFHLLHFTSQPPSQKRYWIYWSPQSQIGHPSAGPSCGARFSEWSSRLHKEIIWLSKEKVQRVLL